MSPIGTAFEATQADVEQLLVQVERYLAVVEEFRAEGCEPAYEDDEAALRLLIKMS
jgi:hypothetical protein